MIFYFTGTGNSQWVADQLGSRLDQRVFSIATLLKNSSFRYALAEQEAVIFVFPVHCWGPPSLVTAFIRNLSLEGYNGQPVYVVCTCGDDCGYSDRMVAQLLRQKGWELTGCWSVTMPNNYILLPGFDVDSAEETHGKLDRAVGSVERIGETIARGELFDGYTTGRFTWVKSRVIWPWFVKFALGKNAFYATEACTHCGLCEKICPTGTIYMERDTPRWKPTCVQCLACIHRCPVRAIESGKTTLRKGRYHYPGLR